MSEHVSTSEPPYGRLRILIIDDSEFVCTATKRVLELDDGELFEVSTCQTGRQALEMLDEHGDAIAAVVLDMHLPDFDAVQLLSDIRHRFSAVRVLAVSGIGEDELTREFSRQPPDGFLRKPFTGEVLVQKLREVARK